MKINPTQYDIDSGIPTNKGCGSVMMDMQEKLLQEVDNKNQIEISAILQLKIFRLLNIHQCFTEQVPEKLGTTLPSILSQNAQTPVFSKDTFSAFGCKSFVEWIELKNIDHLFLSGIEVPICIYQTCLDALRENLQVTIISDCVGARRSMDSKVALAQLCSFGCNVIPLETGVYSVLRSSTHSKFREVSKLIRDRE